MPIHERLISHFRGFQGAKPNRATYLFIGKDANFPHDFQEGHEIWACLKAYLRGRKDWLSRQGRAERHIHHPALLKAWPWRGGGKYHSTFAKLFEVLAVDDPDVRSKCSFVESIRWPRIGDIEEENGAFEALFNGVGQGFMPNPLQDQFRGAQLRHRTNLGRWITNCPGVVVIPKKAFKLIWPALALPPNLANLAAAAQEHFQHAGNWFFHTGPASHPRVLVTEHFPYFRTQPPGVAQAAVIEIIAGIIAGH